MPEVVDLPSTATARRTLLSGSESVPPEDKRAYIPPDIAESQRTDALIGVAGLPLWKSPDEFTIWNHRPNIREYPIDGELLLFHPDLQLLCRLNKTASFIWRNSHGKSASCMADSLRESFAVEESTARQHVLRIVELFAMNQFILPESVDATAE